MIGGTKVVLDAVAFPFKGIFAGAAMEMAINHIAHPMGFQQLCKAAGLAFFVEGGIVEHTDFRQVWRGCLQGKLQADALPVVELLIPGWVE